MPRLNQANNEDSQTIGKARKHYLTENKLIRKPKLFGRGKRSKEMELIQDIGNKYGQLAEFYAYEALFPSRSNAEKKWKEIPQLPS